MSSVLVNPKDLRAIFNFVDGGSDPIWNQSFLFEVPGGVSDLKVAIFDAERHGKDESMGFAV